MLFVKAIVFIFTKNFSSAKHFSKQSSMPKVDKENSLVPFACPLVNNVISFIEKPNTPLEKYGKR